MPIHLKPGQQIKRSELQDRYGGRRQGGISPSKKTPHVFLFTDPVKGARHGYIYDGQGEGDIYNYTGEGQEGDQRMVQGNRAIRDHREEGRELHLFDVSGGLASYVGEFEYVGHESADAPATKTPERRKVIVFHLRRLTGDSPLPTAKVEQFSDEPVKVVPIEQHLTERMVIEPNREPYEAERREQPLVLDLMAYLRGQGHQVDRLQLRPIGEPAPLFCDLFDSTTNTVVEAKGSVSRGAIRMAIGQLVDYSRLIDPAPAKVILVPEEPRRDLLDLAESADIGVTWPDGDGGFAVSG
ncbi:MAG TPA: hypothetical protein VG448_12865 [Solirubrobacterales bacterium]|nr:hypothetical protein [Solirubrobacterales bacterium]